MTFNFFDEHCREPARDDRLFGLCDDEDGTRAYADTKHPDRWIATVKNDQALLVVFTAIDKCVLKDAEAPGISRCDGMLTTNHHLYFVELKNTNWASNAIEQLESTVKLFLAAYPNHPARHKKAFACNKRRPRFTVIDNATNAAFFRKYGVRLDIQAEIVIL